MSGTNDQLDLNIDDTNINHSALQTYSGLKEKETAEEKRSRRDRMYDEKVRHAPRSILDSVPLEHTKVIAFTGETIVFYGLVHKVRSPGVTVPTMLLMTNLGLYKLDLMKSRRIRWRLPLRDIHSLEMVQQ